MGFIDDFRADILSGLASIGDSHVVDGQEVTARVKDISFNELGPNFVGSIGQAKRLCANSAELTGNYAPGRTTILDGVKWDIASVLNHGGLLIIDLYRNRL